MKITRIMAGLLVFAGVLVLGACGGGDRSDTSGTTSIVITGNDMMQFSVTEFTVKAGSEVSVTFRNIGQMPKEAMGHNLAILMKDVDPMSFSAASQRHPQNEYIDPALEHQVLAATRVLGPGEEQTLTFTVPDAKGDYHFVCSFPGHTMAGMRGVMKVQ